MKKLFYTAGISIALSVGCSGDKSEPTVLFANPQPQAAKDFAEFPTHLLGEYLSEPDSNLLSIRRDGIYRNAHYPIRIHINELDSTWVLTGDSLLVDKKGKTIAVKRDMDSLNMDFDQTDTLFRFDKDHSLRKFKNSYILNTRHEESWRLGKLEKRNKLLTLSYIDEKEADLLKTLSDNFIDSLPYKFSISSSNFREFMKSGAFTSIDTFKLIQRRPKAFLRFRK